MIFKHCRSCGTPLEEIFTLGELYVSNFIDGNASSKGCAKSDITLCLCGHCQLLQLKESIDPNILYKNYWYKSGINNSMKESLRDVADTAMKSVKTKDKDIFLDIACNDGTLLNYVHGNMIKVGIDPSNVAKVNNGTLVNDYFSARAYYGVAHKGGHLPQAKIITCIAMFYDLDDPRDFLRDVRKVLRDDGIFVVQMSYTPLMFKQVAFDNMCAEHVCYYDLQSLEYVLKAAGFKVVDCTLNDVNGGSFRVTCMKDNADVKHFKSQTERDVANLRVEALREYESGNVGKEATTFGNKIWGLRKDVTNFIFHATQRECKTVYAYGASTKGNTLLQYFGLTNITITAAVERNPDKVGLKTVGTEIPIISEEQMRENPPDYLLLLPWHFIREFEEREAEFLKNGGKFIVPCPEFEIVEYNG
jgi:SAM-dependent methyltransferase